MSLSLLDRVACDVGRLEVSFACPVLVLGGDGPGPAALSWRRHGPGLVTVPMLPFERAHDPGRDVTVADCEHMLEALASRGIALAFNGDVPVGPVGTLYVREPWVTAPGRGIWGRFGAVIRVAS
jgi:hypothetical protein